MESASRPASEAELRSQLADATARFGAFHYDVPLPFGVWTRGEHLPHTRLKRIVQIARDLCPIPLNHARVLDLGCLDGQFSVEFALHGAEVLGLDVRDDNVGKANFLKRVLGLDRLTFVQADVRSLKLETHGEFDVVVCSGLLYHLTIGDVVALVRELFRMTRHVVAIDTHVSLTPTELVTIDGHVYHGHYYKEHSTGDSDAQKAGRAMASWGNDASFWLSRPSLVNLLSHAGFSSTYECFTPPHVNFGKPGTQFDDRCTIVALKRPKVQLHTSPAANQLDEDWPEGTLQYAPVSLSTRVGRAVRRLLGRA